MCCCGQWRWEVEGGGIGARACREMMDGREEFWEMPVKPVIGSGEGCRGMRVKSVEILEMMLEKEEEHQEILVGSEETLGMVIQREQCL
jgi:hypothetical protein